MDDFSRNLHEYWPYLAMILLVIAHRLIAQSALRYLTSDQKVALVDAAPKHSWAYLAFFAAFALFFVDVVLGAFAIVLYLISAMSYNYFWATKNGFPAQYRYRVLLANLIVLAGVTIIAVLTGLVG